MDLMALRDFTDLLDIPAVRVTEYRKEQDQIDVCVELEKNSATCPSCGVRSSRKHSQKLIQVRDLPCFGRHVYLLLPRRRFKCRHCSKVMKNLTGALTKCRREIQRGMSKDSRDELKGLRWILVKNECNLDKEEKAKLKDMYKKCPELKTCHKLKEDFRSIFEEETSRTKAKARLHVWKQRAKKTELKSLEGFLSTLDNWEEWILNYFSSGKITNGVVEGINNKLKLIKRRAYGYRNNGNFRQRVLVECGG